MQLADLLEGSFKGVLFLFSEGTKKYGRKTVSHEYPNQDSRYVEDLGLHDDKFTVNAYIASNNYRQNRDALESALKSAGPGIFVHPFYGQSTVMVCSVIVTEDITKLGEVKFEIEFEKTRGKAPFAPTGVISAPASLLKSALSIDSQISSWIGSHFNVSNIFPRNFLDSINQLQGLSGTFTGIVSGIAVSTGLTTFTTALKTFTSGINSLIQSPTSLGQSIVGLMDNFQLLETDPSSLVSLNQNLFNYGGTDPRPTQITQERIERVQNQDVVDTAVQALALSNAYVAAGSVAFFDTAELDTVRTQLDAQYELMTVAPQMSPDVMQTLQDMRNTVRELFSNDEVNLYRLSEIITHEIPVTVLAYQYYGDTSFDTKIIAVNNIVYPPQVEGALQLFVR